MDKLNDVIVRAKAACYVGGGAKGEPSRRGSQDLIWSDAEWEYRDSYFGGTNFIGQEVLWLRRTPYWAMNYYGFIIRPDLIDGERAGSTIKTALSGCIEPVGSSVVSNGRVNTGPTSTRARETPAISTGVR